MLSATHKESQEVKNKFCVMLKGVKVSVCCRYSSRAQKLVLRILKSRCPEELDGVAVTVPKGITCSEAIEFVEKEANWVLRSLSNLPDLVKFSDGVIVPYLGIAHQIVHEPYARRGVWRSDGIFHVSGKTEFLARRLTDWLKREAREAITVRVTKKTKILKTKAGRISIRDTRSRWGSCAANGNLSFSWRLIMAPEFVFDYVVAHEVAHIIEHNHGPRFWQLTQHLCKEVEQAKNWLRHNGEVLLRYI